MAYHGHLKVGQWDGHCSSLHGRVGSQEFLIMVGSFDWDGLALGHGMVQQ